MQVVRKLISLSETVAAELDKEKNMSALVDVLLGEFYGVEVVETGTGAPAREEVKNRLAEIDASLVAPAVAEVVTPTEPVAEPVAAEVPVTPVVVETPPVAAEELATTATISIDPPQSVTDPAPVPTEATVIAPVEEPVSEPVADVPINVNGAPGGICEIHGAFVGSICIDCL